MQKHSNQEKYKLAVFIGRFQPFHSGHLHTVQMGLNIAEHVLIIVGSQHCTLDPKNPFTYDERYEMIKDCFVHQSDKISIRGVRDYFYHENHWVTSVQNLVSEFDLPDDSICMIGHYKDGSSYYFDSFPQWKFEPIRQGNIVIDATDIRKLLFEENKNYEEYIPEGTKHEINRWIKTKTFHDLKQEYHYIENYKQMWNLAPYPVTFVTTDCVVVKSGHVLLVERKINPGKGKLAVPGGFLKPNAEIFDSALRELKEETRINIPKVELAKLCTDSKVFDYPGRSLRGRTVTHSFYFDLNLNTKIKELPSVKGDDDAKKAFWMPLADIRKNEERFFEDHIHIINYFIYKN